MKQLLSISKLEQQFIKNVFYVNSRSIQTTATRPDQANWRKTYFLSKIDPNEEVCIFVKLKLRLSIFLF
jgi:hypothetical protein